MAEKIWEYDEKGLVLTGDITEDQWKDIGRSFGFTTSSLLWALGDWLVLGFAGKRKLHNRVESRWLGSNFLEASYITSLTTKRLAGLYRVAKAFPRDHRIVGASWTHHQACVKLPAYVAADLLQAAATKGWSFSEMHAHFPVGVHPQSRATESVRSGSKRLLYVRCPQCQHEFAVRGHKVQLIAQAS